MLAVILFIAGADQLFGAGLAQIAQQALSNLAAEGGADEYTEDQLPPSLIQYIEEQGGEQATYEETEVDEIENILPPSLSALSESIDELAPLDEAAGEALEINEVLENYENEYEINEYESIVEIAPLFVGIVPFSVDETITVSALAELRAVLSGSDPRVSSLSASSHIEIVLQNAIAINGGGTLPVTGHFQTVTISGANLTATENPALTISGAGRTANINVNVTSGVAAGTVWNGIRVQNGATLNLNGNVIRNNRRSNGAVTEANAINESGVFVDNSTFNHIGGTISMFRQGVRLVNNANMTMENGAVIQNNRTFQAHAESGPSDGNGVGGNAGTGNGGGVWLSNSIFTMNGGRIGSASDTARGDGNSSGNGGGGVRAEAGSQFTMNGGLIQGNRTTPSGAGGNSAGAAATARGGGGVLIENSTFIMNDGLINANFRTGYAHNWSSAATAPVVGGGGGVFLGHNGIMTMNGGTISRNNSRRIGGIAVATATSRLTMNGGAISENVSLESLVIAGGGGGVLLHTGSIFNMTGGSINNNGSMVYGADPNHGAAGGVYIMPGATMNMSGGQITENRAGSGANQNAWNASGNQINPTTSSRGGGVFLRGNTSVFNMSGGYILRNRAGVGGGIAFQAGGGPNRVNITGGAIVANHAFNDTQGGGGGGIAAVPAGHSAGAGAPANAAVYAALNVSNAIIAGNSIGGLIGGVVPYGIVTQAVQAQARRDDALFNAVPHVRVSETTLNSFVGIPTHTGGNWSLPGAGSWTWTMPQNISDWLDANPNRQPNPFNNLDIRTTAPTAQNFVVIPPYVFREIYVQNTATADAAWVGSNAALRSQPAPIDNPVRMPFYMFSTPTVRPAGTIAVAGNGLTPALSNVRHLTGPITDVLTGYYWRYNAGSTTLPTFQYSFVDWNSVASLNRLAQNQISFTMPVSGVTIQERLNRTPVLPYEVTLYANSVTTIPQGAIRRPEVASWAPPTNSINNTPIAYSDGLLITSRVLDNFVGLTPAVPDLHRDYTEPSATWVWNVTRPDNATNPASATSFDTSYAEELVQINPIQVARNVPGTAPAVSSNQPREARLTVGHEVPIGTVVRVWLSVTSPHLAPNNVTVHGFLDITVEGVNRVPTAIIMLPDHNDPAGTPTAFSMRQGAAHPFRARVLSQFGEDITSRVTLAWTSGDTSIATVDRRNDERVYLGTQLPPLPTHIPPPTGADLSPDPVSGLANVTVLHAAYENDTSLITATVTAVTNTTSFPMVMPGATFSGTRTVRVAGTPRWIDEVTAQTGPHTVAQGNIPVYPLTNPPTVIANGGSGALSSIRLHPLVTIYSQFPNEVLVYGDPLRFAPAATSNVGLVWDIVEYNSGNYTVINPVGLHLVTNTTGALPHQQGGYLLVDWQFDTGASNSAVVLIRATANTPRTLTGPPQYPPAPPEYAYVIIPVTVTRTNRVPDRIDVNRLNRANGLISDIVQDETGEFRARVYDQFAQFMPASANQVTWALNTTPDTVTTISSNAIAANPTATPTFDENRAIVTAPYNAIITAPNPPRIITVTTSANGGSGAPITATIEAHIIATPRYIATVNINRPSAHIYQGNSAANVAAIPRRGSANVHYVDFGYDLESAFGEVLPNPALGVSNATVTWSIVDNTGAAINPTGVSIDPNTGRLTVYYTATPGEIRIRATAAGNTAYQIPASGGNPAHFAYSQTTIIIRENTPFPDSIVVSPIAVPIAVNNPLTIMQNRYRYFEASAFDQFNRPMANVPFTWNLPTNPAWNMLAADILTHITNVNGTTAGYTANNFQRLNVGANAIVAAPNNELLIGATANAPRRNVTATQDHGPATPATQAFGQTNVVVSPIARFPDFLEVRTPSNPNQLFIYQSYVGTPSSPYVTAGEFYLHVAIDVRNQFSGLMVPNSEYNNNSPQAPVLNWSVSPANAGIHITHPFTVGGATDFTRANISAHHTVTPGIFNITVTADAPRLDADSGLALTGANSNATFTFPLTVRETVRFPEHVTLLGTNPASPDTYDNVTSPAHGLIAVELDGNSPVFNFEVRDQFGIVMPNVLAPTPNVTQLNWNPNAPTQVTVNPGNPANQTWQRSIYVRPYATVGTIVDVTVYANNPRRNHTSTGAGPTTGSDIANNNAQATFQFVIVNPASRPLYAAIYHTQPNGTLVHVAGTAPRRDAGGNVVWIPDPSNVHGPNIVDWFTPVGPAAPIEMERITEESFTVHLYDRLGRHIIDPAFNGIQWTINPVSSPGVSNIPGGTNIVSPNLHNTTLQVLREISNWTPNMPVAGYPRFDLRADSLFTGAGASPIPPFAQVPIQVVTHNRVAQHLQIEDLINQELEPNPPGPSITSSQASLTNLVASLPLPAPQPGSPGSPLLPPGASSLNPIITASNREEVYAYYTHRFIARAYDRLGYETEINPTHLTWSWTASPTLPALQASWVYLSTAASPVLPNVNSPLLSSLGVAPSLINNARFSVPEDDVFEGRNFNITVTVNDGIVRPGGLLNSTAYVMTSLSARPEIEFPNTRLPQTQLPNGPVVPSSIFMMSTQTVGARVFDKFTPAYPSDLNAIHPVSWSIVDRLNSTDLSPSIHASAAFADPAVTINPATGELTLASTDDNLIGRYVYVRASFITPPQPRYRHLYNTVRIRIVEPPRVPTHVRIFDLGTDQTFSNSLPAPLWTHTIHPIAGTQVPVSNIPANMLPLTQLPLAANGGWTRVAAVVFDQLMVPYTGTGGQVTVIYSNNTIDFSVVDVSGMGIGGGGSVVARAETRIHPGPSYLIARFNSDVYIAIPFVDSNNLNPLSNWIMPGLEIFTPIAPPAPESIYPDFELEEDGYEDQGEEEDEYEFEYNYNYDNNDYEQYPDYDYSYDLDGNEDNSAEEIEEEQSNEEEFSYEEANYEYLTEEDSEDFLNEDIFELPEDAGIIGYAVMAQFAAFNAVFAQ